MPPFVSLQFKRRNMRPVQQSDSPLLYFHLAFCSPRHLFCSFFRLFFFCVILSYFSFFSPMSSPSSSLFYLFFFHLSLHTSLRWRMFSSVLHPSALLAALQACVFSCFGILLAWCIQLVSSYCPFYYSFDFLVDWGHPAFSLVVGIIFLSSRFMLRVVYTACHVYMTRTHANLTCFEFFWHTRGTVSYDSL